MSNKPVKVEIESYDRDDRIQVGDWLFTTWGHSDRDVNRVLMVCKDDSHSSPDAVGGLCLVDLEKAVVLFKITGTGDALHQLKVYLDRHAVSWYILFSPITLTNARS
jgi:hypothetical protein